MIEIRILNPSDVEAFRTVRLRSLAEHPEAFGASLEEEQQMSVDQFAERLNHDPAQNTTFGAWNDKELYGIVNVDRYSRAKTRHRVILGGMYVVPEARGKGIGRLLVQTAVDHARSLVGLDHIVLAVTVGNEPARQLYTSLGFQSWGIDPRYIRVNNTFYDIEWMVLHLENK